MATSVVVEGIGDGLSVEQANALDLLTSLPVEQFNHLKDLMELSAPGILGPTTLEKFLELCTELKLDLSEAGVNKFKDNNLLGNTGNLRGVIGPQTAGVYYDTIIRLLDDEAARPVGGPGQHINQEGLDLVKEFEGLEQRKGQPAGKVIAYLDPVKVLTIGYGHTGPDVRVGQVITFAEAENLLRQDLTGAEADVLRLVKVPLTSNQFSALVSFTFNLGAGSLKMSTLLRLLNAGDFKGAANQFPRWNRAGGRILNGLVRRRKAEQALFLKP